ncbi:MAG: tRNA (N6-threonylcarbamoyladenosine(37)-N6)-methyltransferase TrmO [Desulfarculaceae bacterium]|nr:tRNA (N6-threonylcarbamoyladenosine(37)-N6)-methyltransferase TrmO [Desulfarculaceae bacterium]
MAYIESIGTIRSPFTRIEDMPIQPTGAGETAGSVEVNKAYKEGLKDLAGFSHVYLLYLFHKAGRMSLTVTPFMDTVERGVYATRSPLRPNHIGISIVRLLSVEKNIITIGGVDVLDGTPLIDIKPYIENFDRVENSVSGWMTADREEVAKTRSDGRFG